MRCRCAPTHRGRPIDLGSLNTIRRPRPTGGRFPYLIVPGYTPRLGWRGGLHPKNVERLSRALDDLRAGWAPVVIVSGGAVHSPDNEALLMRAWLLRRGVEEEQIIVEPCARHTTTNLRNAGRVILQAGAAEAVVVSSDQPDWRPRRTGWRFADQSYYLGFPWISTFHLRCMVELGYRVGELTWMEPMHVHFRPSPEVFRRSWRDARTDP
jgi:hypothetical protein